MACFYSKQWCRENIAIVKIVWEIIALILYVLDISTDIYATVQFISDGHYIWGSLTLVFTLVPMMIPSIEIITNIMQASSDTSGAFKYLQTLPLILCAPTIPLGILFLKVVGRIRNHKYNNDDDDNDEEHDDFVVPRLAGRMKIIEAMVESYPQASIQMYIVFDCLRIGKVIQTWQLISIAVSLTNLAFSVSSNSILFGKAASSSKATFCMLGLLAIASRLITCGVYSLEHKTLWCVPIGTMVAASIIVWSIIRWCRCSVCVPLDGSIHNSSKIMPNIFVGIFWVLMAAYNSFTITGLVFSTVNLAYAIGACFLPTAATQHFPIVITAVILASISWTANILLTVVPYFRSVRYDWLRINDEGESKFY